MIKDKLNNSTNFISYNGEDVQQLNKIKELKKNYWIHKNEEDKNFTLMPKYQNNTTKIPEKMRILKRLIEKDIDQIFGDL